METRKGDDRIIEECFMNKRGAGHRDGEGEFHMMRRFLMIFVTLMIAIGAILLAARHPTGPNSVSYDEPLGLWLSIGMTIILFIPLFIFSLFSNKIVKIISVVLQTFVAMSFLFIIPIGFFLPENLLVSVVGVLGVVVSVVSIIVTLKTNSRR